MNSIKQSILFFADRMPPLVGGMEMHAKYFIEYFNNHQSFPIVGVVTKNERGSDILILNDRNHDIKIDDLDKILNPDIIFFNSGRWIEDLSKIRILFPDTKFIYRTGGNEILKAPLAKNYNTNHSTRQSYWVETINNNIDILITNSTYTEERLNALGINTLFKRFVGGVNVAEFKNIKYIKNKFVTIFCAARFVPYKNHSLMISVINELVLRGLKLQVKLAGDGLLLTQTKQHVQQYNLSSVVKFLGAVDNSEACKEIFNADIYMQLSKDHLTQVEGGSYIHSEGMGRSILEALSAGTFVIAGKSGALPEVVKPPAGLLLCLNDPMKIADQIEIVIKTRTIKRALQTNFDWKEIFTGYKRLFGNI